MQQQVNFYQPQFRARSARLPATMLLQACAAVVVAMLLLYAYGAWRVGGVQGDLRVIAQQEAAALQRLENLQSTIADVVGETSWATRLDDASRLLAEKEASLRLISGTELGNTGGFAPHLAALARQATAGLWLTHVALSGRGDRIWLQGEATRADNVPNYLQNLAAEPPFAAQRFHRLEIDRPADEPSGIVSFVVTSNESLGDDEVLNR
ncbi:MAG: PilN domain-containing protein [Woeseiaceae bacterium]|nr:PilN domain-containing protein [Woeseiaceae bacterium]